MYSKSLKNILIRSASATTMHGLPNMVRTKRLLVRIVWAFCFLIAFALCAYLIIESFINYLKFDVVTTVRIINEPYAEFPAIMLCNKNNLNDDLYEDLLNHSIINETFLKSLKKENINDLSIKLENLKIRIYSFILNRNGKNIYDYRELLVNMLLSCRHGSDICTINDFRSYFHLTFGFCSVLYSMMNSENKSKKVIDREGIYNSLQIELYLGKPKKLEFLSSSVGFRLFLLNRSENLNNYEPIDLAPGFEYSIVIDRTFVQQIPAPYSNCEVFQSTLKSYDSELTREFIKNNQTYRQTHCFDLCYQILSVKVCNCTDYIFDLRKPSKICFEPNQLECIQDFYYSTYSKNDYIKKNCVPLCPRECESISILPTVSSSKYPSDQYFEILRTNQKLENSNFSYMKNSILKLNIYYQRLAYTLITESPTTSIVDLLSNFGGILV